MNLVQGSYMSIPRSNTFSPMDASVLRPPTTTKAVGSGAMSPLSSHHSGAGPPRCSSFSAYTNVKSAAVATFPLQQQAQHAPPATSSVAVAAGPNASMVRPGSKEVVSGYPSAACFQTPAPRTTLQPAVVAAHGHRPGSPVRAGPKIIMEMPPQSGLSPLPGNCSAQGAMTPLEVSQRMARANELQHRLAVHQQPGQSQGQIPGLQAPSLLNWVKSRGEGQPHEQSIQQRVPPPLAMPKEQQRFNDGETIGALGLSTLHSLPPPPRSAPAAESAMGGGAYGGCGGCGGGCGGGGAASFHLRVLTSDSRWETLSFSAAGDLEGLASSFLQQKGLKAAFLPGLVAKMRSMSSTGQTQSSVDIVDLI